MKTEEKIKLYVIWVKLWIVDIHMEIVNHLTGERPEPAKYEKHMTKVKWILVGKDIVMEY